MFNASQNVGRPKLEQTTHAPVRSKRISFSRPQSHSQLKAPACCLEIALRLVDAAEHSFIA